MKRRLSNLVESLRRSWIGPVAQPLVWPAFLLVVYLAIST